MNTTPTNLTSIWNPTNGILITTLVGTVGLPDVAQWEAGLLREVSRVPHGGRFLLLSDLRGYEPASLDAHKAMRFIVPSLLARHGLQPAVAGLFPELPEIVVSTERDIRCVGFAQVHHDEGKMTGYEARIATPTQRFFTDFEAAYQWLLAVDRASG